MNKEEMRKMLPLIKEWVENPDAEMYCSGHHCSSPNLNCDPEDYEVRYPKKTIIVNGVEVPAPEKKGLGYLTTYFVSSVEDDTYFVEYVWDNSLFDILNLDRGLVYLNMEDAITRAKAMLLFKEK